MAQLSAATWTANWIWQASDGPANTWMAFRKSFTLTSVPASAMAQIAVDSKYYLWINGALAVFEGGLNRGPTPSTGYYDEVDISKYLVQGSNTVAVLVWFWGNQGRNNVNSGKGGLVFEAAIGDTVIKSDRTWRMVVHPAYTATGDPQPSFLYAGWNIGFDARKDIPTWTQKTYDDAVWSNATEKGVPPVGPWNGLAKRPVPLWKNSGLKAYVNAPFPSTSSGTIIAAKLPYAAQVTPYLKINASAGLKIDIRTDRYRVHGGPGDGNLYNGHRAEYTTTSGIQEFEMLNWIFGDTVFYTIPAGVTILDLQYRETGYATEFAGSFACDVAFFNVLWEKARRTLYICMRDNFMDCPDRERGQWIGDVSSQVPQVFYALDSGAYKLVRKCISDFISWRNGAVLRGNVPGADAGELPSQSLNAICDKGMIMSHFMNTGDSGAIREAYPAIKAYLNLWALGSDGLIVARSGSWQWYDHGNNIDSKVIVNAWFYLALKAALKMATLTGNTADTAGFAVKMRSIESNFDNVLWKGSAYRSGSIIDDRANGMAVLAELASKDKWPAIKTVLTTVKNSTPYMEGYVLEALCMMGYNDAALVRMKQRYTPMTQSTYTTLWEDFSGWGTRNHAWSGGPLTVLNRYIAGVAPDSTAWSAFHVLPNECSLKNITVAFPTVKGKVSVAIAKTDTRYTIDLTSPSATRATAGIPCKGRTIDSIYVNGHCVWRGGSFISGTAGITGAGADSLYIKFLADPGMWKFVAYGSGFEIPPLAVNLAAGFPVKASSSWDTGEWGVSKLTDGITTSVTGSKGYTSDPPAANQNKSEWVEIDLGQAMQFNQIKLYPRTDEKTVDGFAPGWPVNYTIQVKAESGIYTTVQTITNDTNKTSQPKVLDFSNQSGRYVKIDVTTLGTPALNDIGRYRFQLAELEVYYIPKVTAKHYSGTIRLRNTPMVTMVKGTVPIVKISASGNYSVSLINAQGKVLLRKDGKESTTIALPRNRFSRGVYVVQIQGADFIVAKKAIVF